MALIFLEASTSRGSNATRTASSNVAVWEPKSKDLEHKKTRKERELKTKFRSHF